MSHIVNTQIVDELRPQWEAAFINEDQTECERIIRLLKTSGNTSISETLTDDLMLAPWYDMQDGPEELVDPDVYHDELVTNG
jgi:hypothetical protein